MLTGELKNKIDSIWEMFWTGGITNPLDVVEQMTYLMFIHDLDAVDAAKAKDSVMLDLPYTSMFAGHESCKFSKYLDNVNLDDKQIYFVKQIINYIVKNGMMTDFSVMQESPFTDKGTLSEVFTDLTIWLDIKNIIKSINSNAAA